MANSKTQLQAIDIDGNNLSLFLASAEAIDISTNFLKVDELVVDAEAYFILTDISTLETREGDTESAVLVGMDKAEYTTTSTALVKKLKTCSEKSHGKMCLVGITYKGKKQSTVNRGQTYHDFSVKLYQQKVQ